MIKISLVFRKDETNLRVWDLHPGYLSRQNLLGQHAEIHALYNVISGRKKGYANHPETLRWNGNLEQLKRIHELTVFEMKLREFNHKSPCGVNQACAFSPDPGKETGYVDLPARQIKILEQKYKDNEQSGRIPLPKNTYEFWAHHKYSVMARGYQFYKQIQGQIKGKRESPLTEADPVIEQILIIMKEPVSKPALQNVLDHLWGYFKDGALPEEKEIYLSQKKISHQYLLGFFYKLALKYNRVYLLHSTIFADFTGQIFVTTD
ncbi:MAG: DUF1722 domain-containing protein [Bacillota bacterium]